MEDVVAGQSLSACHHFLSADDADVVHCLQLLGGGIWVQCVHVADGSARHDGICHSFLELPHSQVHGPNGEEWEGVHLDHDGHEGHVQQDFDEACEQLRVEHVYGLIVPGVLALEVHGVQHILDEDGEHHGHQNGILKAKHQLHRSPPGEDAMISVADKEEVQDTQEEHKRDNAAVEKPGDVGAALHKVHTVLSQPMETLEEEEESKERHKTRTEVIPKNSEGQTGFGDSVPGPLQKVLHLGCPQLPKEHLAHHFAQEEDKDKGLDVQDCHAGAGLGQIHHSGVELVFEVVGMSHHCPSQRQAGRHHHCGAEHCPGPETRSPAPRARSITATAAPVNNTPHPLRTGTSRVRHLTSGGAGRGGVDCTKCALHVAISPVLPGPRARSRDEQEMGRVVATKSAAGKGCPAPDTFVSHRSRITLKPGKTPAVKVSGSWGILRAEPFGAGRRASKNQALRQALKK